MGNKVAWWTGIMFLTNVFFIPFLALRAAPQPDTANQGTSSGAAGTGARQDAPVAPNGAGQPGPSPSSSSSSTSKGNAALPAWAPAMGALGLFIGGMSMVWAAAARPEYGDLAARWQYFLEAFNGNRVFYAFIVDSGLYAVWQSVLLQGAAPKYRFVPFFGLAAYLMQGGGKQEPAGRDGQQA